MTFHCTSMSEPRPLHADTVCAKSVTNMRRMTSFARQLKQVPEWSWILSSVIAPANSLNPQAPCHALSSSTQEEARVACLRCWHVLPARSPDTLMRQTSQSVVTQPVRVCWDCEAGIVTGERRLVEEKRRRASLFCGQGCFLTQELRPSRLRFLGLRCALPLSVRLQKSHSARLLSTPHPGHSPSSCSPPLSLGSGLFCARSPGCGCFCLRLDLQVAVCVRRSQGTTLRSRACL